MKQQKEYAVLVRGLDNNKISFDVFMATSPEEAKRFYRDCYRHSNYKILSATETGRY